MSRRINVFVRGLGIGLFSIGMAAGLYAQPAKGLQQTTKIVTQPLKDTQKATKTAVEPIKDTRQAVKSVTDAPKTVTREVQATEKSVESAGNEVKRAKNDVDKAIDKVDGDKSKTQDSTAKTQPTPKSSTVVVDERNNRDAVGGGYGERYSVSPSASSAESGAAPVAESEDEYRRVLLPPPSGKTNLSASSGSASGSAPIVQPKPDYSGSPARDALESADFAMETLTDLFQYAVWEGPDKDHTMRSIDYTLKQLKRDIDEIRYKDPDHSVWQYEKQYREWRNTYVQHGGQ